MQKPIDTLLALHLHTCTYIHVLLLPSLYTPYTQGVCLYMCGVLGVLVVSMLQPLHLHAIPVDVVSVSMYCTWTHGSGVTSQDTAMESNAGSVTTVPSVHYQIVPHAGESTILVHVLLHLHSMDLIPLISILMHPLASHGASNMCLTMMLLAWYGVEVIQVQTRPWYLYHLGHI